jgi:hypothetical protein
MAIMTTKNFTNNSAYLGSNAGLPAATLLRAIMKNHPEIRRSVFETLRDRVMALGIIIHDDAWDDLLVASSAELESSKAHVIE